MPLEDFTTYTEVDPNNHIAKTANHVDWQDYRNEDAYLYKDKGAGHFTDWEHKIDVKRLSVSGNALGWTWLLSNNVDDAKGLVTGAKTFIGAYLMRSGGIDYLEIEECSSGTEYSTYYVISLNTWYYLTLQKVGTAFTCKVYSDSARTNLLTTLSLTLHGDWNFRYVFACDSWNTGSAIYGDIDIENLDLQEGGVTEISVSGSVVASGSLVRNRAFTIDGSVTLTGTVALGSPLQKYVSGNVSALGSLLTSKILQVQGSVDGKAVVLLSTGEILVFRKGKLEDVFH